MTRHVEEHKPSFATLKYKIANRETMNALKHKGVRKLSIQHCHKNPLQSRLTVSLMSAQYHRRTKYLLGRELIHISGEANMASGMGGG